MHTCDDTRRALERGELPESREAQEHLEACPACRELVAGVPVLGHRLAGLKSPSVPAGGLGADDPAWVALQANLRAESAPGGWLRNRGTPLRIVLSLSVPAVLVGWNLVAKRRADWDAYPTPRLLGEAALLLVSLWAAIHFALRPLHLPPRNRLRRVVNVVALAVPVGLAALGPAHLAHPASLQGSGLDFWPRALACLQFGAAMAVPAILVLWWADRAQGRRLALAALAAAVGGLTGNFVLHIHCAITDPLHLLVGHASIGLLLIPLLLLVAWVRRRRVQ